MKRSIIGTAICLLIAMTVYSQKVMTPELLWQLGRVSGMGISNDGEQVIYSVSEYDIQENKSQRKIYSLSLNGGWPRQINDTDEYLKDKHISPDGRYKISTKDVKVNKVTGIDHYPKMEKSNVLIYESLNYRHWDTWEDGAFSHLFIHKIVDGQLQEGVDIMSNEAYDCPQMPFGGDEDYVWSPDSKSIVYVKKKKKVLIIQSALIRIYINTISRLAKQPTLPQEEWDMIQNQIFLLMGFYLG